MKNQFISTNELAKLLGVSRITIFNRIKKGDIKAIKIGRNYVIDRNDIKDLPAVKEESFKNDLVDRAVKKTVDEYGETLRLLGKE
ncbi:MAG: helix-turn-helix domain-containing protein [bacterium]